MAQTDVLLTKQPAPQTVPACELPRKLYDVARNTGAYTSSGLATAGFRSAKYLVDEWFQNSYARYHQAFADRDQSERQRHESQQLAAETEALARRTQEDATRKVGARLQDMHGWKSELQHEVGELDAETDLLLAQKQRLERALDATAVPFSIATDNLQCRERRQHPDLVRDHVEIELLKEAELIRNIQELLKRTIMQAVNQIRLNREHKETCEMDWSDKVEAYNIDQTCAHYHNQSAEAQFYPHSAKFEESASTPETWARFTQENLYRAERERLASVNLRVLIDSILRDTAEDLQLQCDAVNLAFERRCEEVEDARHKLTDHLHKTLREITDQEHNVAALKQAIKDKEAPLKVAQTRLYQRSHRPNVELCRDTAQFRCLRWDRSPPTIHAHPPAARRLAVKTQRGSTRGRPHVLPPPSTTRHDVPCGALSGLRVPGTAWHFLHSVPRKLPGQESRGHRLLPGPPCLGAPSIPPGTRGLWPEVSRGSCLWCFKLIEYQSPSRALARPSSLAFLLPRPQQGPANWGLVQLQDAGRQE